MIWESFPGDLKQRQTSVHKFLVVFWHIPTQDRVKLDLLSNFPHSFGDEKWLWHSAINSDHLTKVHEAQQFFRAVYFASVRAKHYWEEQAFQKNCQMRFRFQKWCWAFLLCRLLFNGYACCSVKYPKSHQSPRGPLFGTEDPLSNHTQPPNLSFFKGC